MSTQPQMGLDAHGNEYRDIVKRCADEAERNMRQLANAGIHPEQVLHFRYKELALLRADTQPPEGWVRAEEVPVLGSGVPYTGYFGWIWDNARNVPIYDETLRPAAAPARARPGF